MNYKTCFCPLSRYLIEARWFKQCKKYLGLSDSDEGGGGGGERPEDAHPGPIDNSHLFKTETINENGAEKEISELRTHMLEELDYVLVPEESWSRLVELFGLAEGQEPIARTVRQAGRGAAVYKSKKIREYFRFLSDGVERVFFVPMLRIRDPVPF
jgi:hypothetical protein